MSAKAVIRMPGEGKEISLAGQPMAFLVTGEDTRSTRPCSTGRCRRLFDRPPCPSVQEETFYVLEGECEWQIGDRLVRAKPGTYVFIPPGVPHDIGNASDRPAG